MPDDNIPIVNDPLAGFSENPNQFYNEFDDMPEDIQQVIEENGLSKRKYYVRLKQITENCTDVSKAPYIRGFTSNIPTIDWIAMNYGPGNYLLQFSWIYRNEDGKKVSGTRDLEIPISDAYQDDYEEYQFKKRVERMKRRKRTIEKEKESAEIEQMLVGAGVKDDTPKQSAKEYLQELTSTAKELGLMNNSGSSIKEIVALVLPLLPGVISAMNQKAQANEERFNRLMMLMVQQSQSSNTQLMDVMKSMGPQTGQDSMKEFKDMIFSAIDIKEAINQKESIGDRIINMVQGVLPQLLSIAQMSKQQQQMNPSYQAAKAYMQYNKDIQAVKEDPAIRADVIQRLREQLGDNNTKIILQVAGMEEDIPNDSEPETPPETETLTNEEDNETGDATGDKP